MKMPKEVEDYAEALKGVEMSSVCNTFSWMSQWKKKKKSEPVHVYKLKENVL